MNTKSLWSLLLGLSLLVSTTVRSEDQPATPPPAAPTAPVYRPPDRGTPAARVTGGTRGAGDAEGTLDVLAPDHVGLTTQEQPSLFWCQSKATTARFELAVTEEGKFKPLLKVKIDQAGQSGIRRLKLSDQGIKLAPGAEYEWVVALVSDPANRSKDLIASGFIQRVAPSAELTAKLAKAGKAGAPAVYAEEGLWYDAIEAISNLIDEQPDNKTLRTQRSELLAQVGLKNPAAYDQRMAASK